MRAVATVLCVVFALGFAIGKFNGPDPKVEYRIITETETITETVEVPVPAEIDIDCIRAFNLTDNIAGAGHTFDLNSTEMLRIMSELRKAVFNKDFNTTTALENQLRDMLSDTIGASEVLGLDLPRYHDSAEECKETLE